MASADHSTPTVPRRRRSFLQVGRWLLIAFLLVLLLCRIREPMLRAMGNRLITEDPMTHVDAVFVLGGSVKDRGLEATRVYQGGFSDRFIFTGAPVPSALEALGIDSTEAQCTRNSAVVEGMPLEITTTLNKGTSTFEEAEALLEFAIAERLDTVMIISSRFHLRRIGFVFRKRFSKAGITVLLHGAPSSVFDEQSWWTSEEGLIMLNNEYVKLAYYRLKY